MLHCYIHKLRLSLVFSYCIFSFFVMPLHVTVMINNETTCGLVVRASDFWCGGLGFDSPSARYQAPRLTQPSIPLGVGKSSTSLHRLGLRRGMFACIGWQVTLCDPIWQATPCSSEMDSHEELIRALSLTLLRYILCSVFVVLLSKTWRDKITTHMMISSRSIVTLIAQLNRPSDNYRCTI